MKTANEHFDRKYIHLLADIMDLFSTFIIALFSYFFGPDIVSLNLNLFEYWILVHIFIGIFCFLICKGNFIGHVFFRIQLVNTKTDKKPIFKLLIRFFIITLLIFSEILNSTPIYLSMFGVLVLIYPFKMRKKGDIKYYNSPINHTLGLEFQKMNFND